MGNLIFLVHRGGKFFGPVVSRSLGEGDEQRGGKGVERGRGRLWRDQFLRRPHLKIRDLRCFISVSVDVGFVDLGGLEGLVVFCLDEVCLGCLAGLEDLDLGGVESIRIDMSESLKSSSSIFRFFFVGSEVTSSTSSSIISFLGIKFRESAFTGDLSDGSKTTLPFLPLPLPVLPTLSPLNKKNHTNPSSQTFFPSISLITTTIITNHSLFHLRHNLLNPCLHIAFPLLTRKLFLRKL